MESFNSILYLIFCGMTTIALLIVLNLLLPKRVESAREKLESHAIRCLVIGLVALGLALAVLLLLGYLINSPVMQTMAAENVPYWVAVHSLIRVLLTLLLILLGLGLAGVTAIGLAALAKSLGQRIGKAGSANHASLLGSGLLVISALAPYIGWFVFAPIALGIGFGANIQALFQRKDTRSPKA
ncbi:MAG TPA: hypothetical protein VMT91_11435, partial [Anaerolineales bacterium]|nr:hypothetical protein [Anaerolineales bacterium]